MALKRPLSPELNINRIEKDMREVKRLKLHSIIEQLQNEEAKLILLKKLRTSQQLAIRTNKNPIKISHNLTSSTIRIPNTTKSIPNLPVTLPSSLPIPTTRKSSNQSVTTHNNKIPSNHSLEERQNQAKMALRKQLERDLLSVSTPKPSLQDILFIPNGASLEFPPLIGLEDVIQCLNELQNDRHRLPQRFTDHATIDNPYICDQCGIDFTIRWWKHINSKSNNNNNNNNTMNILCDRCKKQIVRRTLKTEHSTRLKNIIASTMKQDREIEKNFHSLIKQEKASSRTKSSTINLPLLTPPPITTTKTFLSQTTRKGNGIVSSSNHHSRMGHSNKIPMPIHHQPSRSNTTSTIQYSKNNQMIKPIKNTSKQSIVLPSSQQVFPSNSDIFNVFFSSNLVRPTSTKRRTVPSVELK